MPDILFILLLALVIFGRTTVTAHVTDVDRYDFCEPRLGTKLPHFAKDSEIPRPQTEGRQCNARRRCGIPDSGSLVSVLAHRQSYHADKRLVGDIDSHKILFTPSTTQERQDS